MAPKNSVVPLMLLGGMVSTSFTALSLACDGERRPVSVAKEDAKASTRREAEGEDWSLKLTPTADGFVLEPATGTLPASERARLGAYVVEPPAPGSVGPRDSNPSP